MFKFSQVLLADDHIKFQAFNPRYLGNPLTGTFTNSEDPDDNNATFHQGLHCLKTKECNNF